MTGMIGLSNVASSNGGCIGLYAASAIEVEDSEFMNNECTETGSAAYALGAGSNTFTNVSFHDNIASEGGVISFLFSTLTMSNITVEDNIAYADTPGMFIIFGTATFSDSVFTNTDLPNGASTLEGAALDAYTNGGFFSIGAGATVDITTSTFTNGYGINGGFIYISGNAEVTLTDNTFTSAVASGNGGMLYGSSFSNLDVSN